MFSTKKLVSLFLVLFVVFMDWVGIGLVYPMFSSMLFQPETHFFSPELSNNARSWLLGILLASFSTAQFFSGPILGALSDQKGRRPLFIFSLLLAFLGYLVAAIGVFLKSFLLLISGRVIAGVAAGNAGIVSAAIVDLSTEENKAKNFGLYSMACGVGFAIGPFLGGVLSKNGYYIPFFLAALLIFINALLIYFFFVETHHNRKMEQPLPVYRRVGEGWKNFKKAFRVKNLRPFFVATLLFCFGWSFFYEFIPVSWIQDWSFTPQEIGIAYAYGAVLFAMGSGGLIRLLANRFKNEPLRLFTLFALGIVILSIIFPLPQFSIWVYMAIVNLLISIAWPTFTTLVSDYSPKEAQGESLGMFISIQSVSFAFSPLLAGFVLSYGARFTILLGALSMLMAAFIIYTSLKQRRCHE